MTVNECAIRRSRRAGRIAIRLLKPGGDVDILVVEVLCDNVGATHLARCLL